MDKRFNSKHVLEVAPFLAFFIVLCLSTTVGRCDPTDAKQTLPDTAAQQQAFKLVREVYKDDLARAKKPEEKAVLAKRLLHAAIDEQKDPSGRFALFRLADDTAAEGGDVETAYQAVDEMDKAYGIDALQMKKEASVSAAKAVQSPADRKKLIEQMTLILLQAIAADRYDVARQLNETVLLTARQISDTAVIKEAVMRTQQISDAESAYGDVRKAMAILNDKPTDPDANLKVGKFRCFVKDEWEIGIAMLALGTDPVLKALAQNELNNPTTPDDLVALGDGWWAIAEKKSGADKRRLDGHAATSYRKALPQLNGFSKDRIENRLREIAKGDTAVDLTPQGAQQTKGNRITAGPITRKPETLVFADEKSIHAKWEVKGNWRIQGAGLLLDGGDSTIESVARYQGDMKLQISYRMSDNCEIWVFIWGERFEFNQAGNAVAQLERRGDEVRFTSGVAKPQVRKLKEAESGVASTILLHLDRRNLWRPKMELLLKSVFIDGVKAAE